jgi:hypothetical protein
MSIPEIIVKILIEVYKNALFLILFNLIICIA